MLEIMSKIFLVLVRHYLRLQKNHNTHSLSNISFCKVIISYKTWTLCVKILTFQGFFCNFLILGNKIFNNFYKVTNVNTKHLKKYPPGYCNFCKIAIKKFIILFWKKLFSIGKGVQSCKASISRKTLKLRVQKFQKKMKKFETFNRFESFNNSRFEDIRQTVFKIWNMARLDQTKKMKQVKKKTSQSPQKNIVYLR